MGEAILCEGKCPDGAAEAVVVDDGKTVYLYMWSVDPGRKVSRAVWIANRKPAPKSLDGLKRGETPMNPRAYCRTSGGAPPLDRSRLSLVWLPEGDDVALYDGDDLLGAIATWAGEGPCPGYARDAVGEGPVAWSLAGADAIAARFDAARTHWATWNQEPTPWQHVQDAQLAALERAFGAHQRYFVADGSKWPPCALAWFETDAAFIVASIGVALRPMPAVERYTDQPHRFRRIELGAVLPRGTSEETLTAFTRQLGGHTRLPWDRRTFLGHGHTIPCEAFPDRAQVAALLARADSTSFPIEHAPFAGDPVTMLWEIPITAAERERARAEGSAAVLPTLHLPRA